MTLVGLLLPLSVYLLFLGVVNRRRTPFVVAGVWDGVALMLGVSGFFLFAGPLVLERVTDQLHLGWLTNPNATAFGPTQVGLLLSLLYFLAVVCAVAYFFVRQRHLTSIYAVDLDQVEEGLEAVFERLSLRPLQSGRVYFFRRTDPAAPDGPPTVLEVEPFVTLRHVTLRWDPAQAEMREQVEAELTEHLAESTAEPGEVGVWFLVAGLFLFALASVALGVALAALWA